MISESSEKNKREGIQRLVLQQLVGNFRLACFQKEFNLILKSSDIEKSSTALTVNNRFCFS